jgi:hypothetical protein
LESDFGIPLWDCEVRFQTPRSRTAAFVDDAGRIGIDRITLKVDRSKSSGQALTPEPFAVSGTEDVPGAPK